MWTIVALRSHNSRYISLDYFLTQVEKPLKQLPLDEKLEAIIGESDIVR